MKLLSSEPFNWTHWQTIPTIDYMLVRRHCIVTGSLWPTGEVDEHKLTLTGDIGLQMADSGDLIFWASCETVHYFTIPIPHKVYDDWPRPDMVVELVQQMMDEFTSEYNERISGFPSRAQIAFNRDQAGIEAERLISRWYSCKIHGWNKNRV